MTRCGCGSEDCSTCNPYFYKRRLPDDDREDSTDADADLAERRHTGARAGQMDRFYAGMERSV